MISFFPKSCIFPPISGFSRRADGRLHGSSRVRVATDCRKLIAVGLFRDRPACAASGVLQIVKRCRVCAYTPRGHNLQILSAQPVREQEHRLRATVLNRRPDQAIRRWIVAPAFGPKRTAKIINLLARRKDQGGVQPPCFQLGCEQRNKSQWTCGPHYTDYPIIQLLARDRLKFVRDPPEHRLIRRPVQRCRGIRRGHTVSAFVTKMSEPRRCTQTRIKCVSIEPFVMNAIEI